MLFLHFVLSWEERSWCLWHVFTPFDHLEVYVQVICFWKCVCIVTLETQDINSSPRAQTSVVTLSCNPKDTFPVVGAATVLIHTATNPQTDWSLGGRESWLIAWLSLLQQGHRHLSSACPEGGGGWFEKCQPEMPFRTHRHTRTPLTNLQWFACTLLGETEACMLTCASHGKWYTISSWPFADQIPLSAAVVCTSWHNVNSLDCTENHGTYLMHIIFISLICS